MKRAAFLFLAGCPMQDDVVPVRPFEAGVDATLSDASAFGDASSGDAEAGPIFNGGGPFACGTCTCDGTLYACLDGFALDGGCAGGGGLMPLSGDAGDSCGLNMTCFQIPIDCLPKPTCECITKATGAACSVDPSGNGFQLLCASSP